MKNKRKPQPKPEFEELIPLLITLWRKMQKLPVGPLDRLQTREFQSVIEAITRLQTERIFSDKEVLGAYFLYDFILHYAQGLSLIQELPNKPSRVLDLGSGGSPFALAALRHGAQEVFSLDVHPEVLKFGAEVCGKIGFPISVREHDCRDLKFPVEGKWDLIILGYSLSEFFNETQAQERYVRSLMHRLSDEGYILLVESSSQQENRHFLALRDALVANGALIQAPCVWKGQCPALLHASSPCYAQRPFEKPPLIKDIQKAMNINLSSLKMSYLILKSPRSASSTTCTQRLFRVISPPVETFRGERYFLCGTEGKRTLGSRLKEHPKHSKAFEYLRRGDLISIKNPLEVRDDLEITLETQVHLEAPCDKPLPE